jgi:thimet oligopeptidase
MRAMKVEDQSDPGAAIRHWDWRHYSNQIKKQGYSVDTEALRAYFPYGPVLRGMFDIYGEIFGLRFERVEAPWVWHKDVELYVTIDARSDEPLGLFYLDMFPREGKFNHFAQFGITAGKRLESGRYQRPVVALVCNFTPARQGKPSLLTHSEVETLFHEFGHCLHSILTRAEHVRFAGTSVPRDFVEAPSQMLEEWVWDTEILNRFAGHYEDRSKKIDPDVLARMEEAKLATIGTFYRRQLGFALSDLRMHDAGAYKDAQEICNRTMAEIFLAPPEGTHFAAYWGHLAGYDAGYYGYAWADAIAADMATAFESAPRRFLDRRVGMRLRNEIYGVGGSRDAEESIEAFLGRERSIEPFLKSLGIDQPGGR